MIDGLRLQSIMSKALSQFLPTLRATRRRNLAGLAAGLHLAEHVHLSRVAAHRPGTATLSSKTMQLRRFLANEAVNPWACYRPLARYLLEEAAASGRVRLLLDTLELSGRRQILMAALAYRRRALPLAWQVRRQTGVTDAAQQKALLGRIQPLMPENADVVVIGDGEFHATGLMARIERYGWHFCLRLHRDTHVRLADGARSDGAWHALDELAPPEGERRYLDGAYLTRDEPYGPVGLALAYDEGEDEPLLIATDQTASGAAADYLTVRTYSRQRRIFCDWIEELFGDLEGGGFQLHRSRLYKPKRLSRLLLGLAWAYVGLACVGAWVIKRGLRQLVDRTDRRDRSLVEIGRRWLQRCRTGGKPLHMGFKPYF